MSSNVTLRGLLGLGDGPAALQDSALIMIDCQNTYRRGVMQLDGAEEAFAEAARMLARARAAGIPVFHYRPTVVASTTATRDLPVPGGTPVAAATLQAATLAGISDLFAVVAGTPDDIPG
jgi:nicotinamidase-related amidase